MRQVKIKKNVCSEGVFTVVSNSRFLFKTFTDLEAKFLADDVLLIFILKGKHLDIGGNPEILSLDHR